MSGKAGHRGFGHIRKLPSGRYQAMYADPTGRTYLSSKGNARPVSYKAPHTFGSREDAEEWLVDRRREIRTDDWAPPTARRAPITFREHADRWIAHRDLKPRTRMHYQRILNSNLLPSFGDLPLKHITIELVDEWYERLDPSGRRCAHTRTGCFARSSAARCSDASSSSTRCTSGAPATPSG